jgi:PKD repeat protein
MKKALLRYALVVTGFITALTQGSAQNDGYHCGSDHMNHLAREKYPSIADRERLLEDQIAQWIATHDLRADDEDTITITLVFHVIHNYGPENISDEQILDQVRVLNEDYNKRNADTTAVISQFQDLIANCHIRFRLAQRDPLGNCTNGIERIQSLETYIGDDGAKINSWMRDRYLNVWTVNTMRDGVAGYAYYPSAVIDYPMTNADGIIILHNYIGSIGTSAPGRSRALTHEIGHYLNLQHTWGDNNNPGVACGDDLVSDTPITKGHSSCQLLDDACNPGIVENVQNYMEYSYCSNMFTLGQKARVYAALQSSASSRSFLYSDAALAFTRALQEPVENCAPKADFYPDRPFVCIGDLVNFKDNTTNASPTAYSWTFQDGNPSTSTSSNPTVSFTSGGWKSVTLQVVSPGGNDTKTIEKSVYVSEDWSDSGIINENFQVFPNLESFWIANNKGNNNTTWRWTNTAGYDDNYSVFLNAYSTSGANVFDDGDSDIDELITPSMDLSSLSNGTFNFKFAYTTRAIATADITEKLEVYSSIDCGKTWTLRSTVPGFDNVAPRFDLTLSAGNSVEYFIPTEQDQWTDVSFNIPSNLQRGGVRFKFVYTSGSESNNLYIDNININGTVGVDELTENSFSMAVTPNPMSGNGVLKLNTNIDEALNIRVLDLTGKVVAVVNQSRLKKGAYQFDLTNYNLAPGIYFVHATGGVLKETIKFMVTR